MMIRILSGIGLFISMFGLVYVPAMIEDGRFILGVFTLLLALCIGTVSAMYFENPNEN